MARKRTMSPAEKPPERGVHVGGTDDLELLVSRPF